MPQLSEINSSKAALHSDQSTLPDRGTSTQALALAMSTRTIVDFLGADQAKALTSSPCHGLEVLLIEKAMGSFQDPLSFPERTASRAEGGAGR